MKTQFFSLGKKRNIILIYENAEKIKIITLLLELKELYYNLHDTFEKNIGYFVGKNVMHKSWLTLTKSQWNLPSDHPPNLHSAPPQILWPFPGKIKLTILRRNQHFLKYFLRFNVLFGLSCSCLEFPWKPALPMVEVFLFILFLHHSPSQETDFELDVLLKYGLTLFLTLFYKMTLATFKFWWFMLLSWHYCTCYWSTPKNGFLLYKSFLSH